ncbi:MAG TPA: hypothetical protein VMF06_23210 [Candidatus Limnocylindria bacterium]|jgi:hypothetical protein|nr:hypothetical protein [Candidatus Limnocylindria bacterium]
MPEKDENQAEGPKVSNRKINAKLVKVRALRALNEDDTHHEKGDVFEVTEKRAEAISHLAEPVE